MLCDFKHTFAEYLGMLYPWHLHVVRIQLLGLPVCLMSRCPVAALVDFGAVQDEFTAT